MITIFAGPTLSPEEIRAELPDARVEPPAAQGDIWRASTQRPWGIGLIDGYFEHLPAVWHKEVLWAMRQGIHVFGAASMGALRAAELAPYGMVGVGSIFEAFAAGALDRDDEVVVLHGPAESGYRSHSVALVDVRATMAAAARDGVSTPEDGQRVVEAAQRLHYPERTWPKILADVQAQVTSVNALRDWLPEGECSQKHRDAIAMLRRMAEDRTQSPDPKTVKYHFEFTEYWRQGCARAGRRPVLQEALQDELVLDELRLQGLETYRLVAQAGTERVLARHHADRHGLAVHEDYEARVTARCRAELGLTDASSLGDWIARQELTPASFRSLMRREANVRRIRQMVEPELAEGMMDHLRITGDFEALHQRATNKREGMPEEPPGEPRSVETSPLIRWYFEERLGRPVPEDLDEYARRLGLPHVDVWLQLIEREHDFVGLIEDRAHQR